MSNVFQFYGTNIADEVVVGRNFAVWHLTFGDESHRVCTGWHPGTNAVNDASQLVSKGGAPGCVSARLHEVPVL